MSNDKQWIYKSLGGGFSENIKPTTKKPLLDGNGHVIRDIVEGPIFLDFTTGTAVICDAFVKNVNQRIHAEYTAEDLVAMVETCGSFGKTFFLAQSPDMKPDAELMKQVKASEEAASKRGVKVKQGTRGTGDLK